LIAFLSELKSRNETLFYYGVVCIVLALLFFVLSKTTTTQVYGVNAWLKPFKFALSTFLFAWAMAWYCHYLVDFNQPLFNWSVILLLGFEIVYIAIMAGNGEISHYNTSSPLHASLFSMMALAATLVTLYTAFVGIQFFTQSFPQLPSYYLWAIRLSILIFVVFSFEGFAMGSRLSHTVGAMNDNSNLWILGWSKTVGDLRVSHFIGMHALQVLPVLSYHLIKNTKGTVVVALLYGVLAVFTLVQALQGKPFLRGNSTKTGIQN
jgi:hypothetical protein